MIIQLPEGESAVFRNFSDLTERQSRRIQSALRGALGQIVGLQNAGFDENDVTTFDKLESLENNEESTPYELYVDRCIVETISSWTLGELPTMDTVGDLHKNVYDALAEAAVVASRPADALEKPSDPKVPTENSNVSAPISLDVASNQLTPTLPTNGESTVTAL